MAKTKRGRPATGKKRKLIFPLPVTIEERKFLHEQGGAAFIRVRVFPAKLLAKTGG